MPKIGVFAGIDIGGTNISIALVSFAGSIIRKKTIETLATEGPKSGISRIKNSIRELISHENKELIAIGIGCTGPVDRESGKIKNPYTLPSWEEFSITKSLQEDFGVPVEIENDAQAAALGEQWKGAGQDVQNLVYITIGTGVGGGIIIDGDLYRGNNEMAGEIGHMIISDNGPQCYCGAKGCLESLIAAPALVKKAKKYAKLKNSRITKIIEKRQQPITAKVIAEAASQNDLVAKSIIEEAAIHLGIGIRNLIVTLMPEMIILGGGVMKSYSQFEPKIIDVINNLHLPMSDFRLEHAALGLNAGVIGGARTVINQHFV